MEIFLKNKNKKIKKVKNTLKKKMEEKLFHSKKRERAHSVTILRVDTRLFSTCGYHYKQLRPVSANELTEEEKERAYKLQPWKFWVFTVSEFEMEVLQKSGGIIFDPSTNTYLSIHPTFGADVARIGIYSQEIQKNAPAPYFKEKEETSNLNAMMIGGVTGGAAAMMSSVFRKTSKPYEPNCRYQNKNYKIGKSVVPRFNFSSFYGKPSLSIISRFLKRK